MLQAAPLTHPNPTPSARLCISCTDPIPAKRLAAVPHATKCVACQERNDVPSVRVRVTNMARLSLVPAHEDDGALLPSNRISPIDRAVMRDRVERMESAGDMRLLTEVA